MWRTKNKRKKRLEYWVWSGVDYLWFKRKEFLEDVKNGRYYEF